MRDTLDNSLPPQTLLTESLHRNASINLDLVEAHFDARGGTLRKQRWREEKEANRPQTPSKKPASKFKAVNGDSQKESRKLLLSARML